MCVGVGGCVCVGWGEVRCVEGGVFMGNQLRPHARNILIGIQARAVTASRMRSSLHTHSFLLPRRRAPESSFDVRDEPVHSQKPQ